MYRVHLIGSLIDNYKKVTQKLNLAFLFILTSSEFSLNNALFVCHCLKIFQRTQGSLGKMLQVRTEMGSSSPGNFEVIALYLSLFTCPHGICLAKVHSKSKTNEKG